MTETVPRPQLLNASELDMLAKASDELRRVRPIVELATRIGREWHDQGGINGALLDELAELVR